MNVTARDAGLAMAASLSRCSHRHRVPVDLVMTGEVVAMLCADCLRELPLAWGCPDCEWIEVRELCSAVPSLELGRPCPAHRA